MKRLLDALRLDLTSPSDISSSTCSLVCARPSTGSLGDLPRRTARRSNDERLQRHPDHRAWAEHRRPHVRQPPVLPRRRPRPIEIGEDCHLAPQVMVLTATHGLDDDGHASREEEYLTTVIGDHVWIGARAIILPGAVVEDGCVVAAGAVVTGHCAAGGVYGGCAGQADPPGLRHVPRRSVRPRGSTRRCGGRITGSRR